MKKQKRIKVMTHKKWRWLNKLWLYISNPFSIDVDYSVELKKRLSFSRFIRNQAFLLLILLLPVVALIVFPICYGNNTPDNDFYKVNFFDIVAAISTYVGTSALALIVWHSTWLQKREKENEFAIRVHAEIEFNSQTNSALFVQDGVTNIRVVFTNQNNQVPISVKFVKAFKLDKTVVTPIPGPAIISYEHQNETKLLDDSALLLSFNEVETISVGFKSDTISLPSRLYLVFHISNAYGHKVYCIVNCTLDKSGFCCDMFEKVRLVDISVFKKYQSKFGYNFIKEIVWYSPAGLNKRWINRIHMFKIAKFRDKSHKEGADADAVETKTI